MANRILYRPTNVVFSSLIGDIIIAVDEDYIDVVLKSGEQTILSERYYQYNGIVTISNISSLIEAVMQSQTQFFADFNLQIYKKNSSEIEDSCIYHVLYCDRYILNIDIENFLAENFLTTLSMRRVASGSTLSLFFYAEKGESLEYSVLHKFRKQGRDTLYSNSFVMQSGHTANSAGVEQINISVNEIIADAASFASAKLGEIEPVSFTVRLGQRSISCFIDPALDNSDIFFFRNCFNVWDFITLPLQTTAKTAVDRSTAVVNGTSQFYDQSVEKTYEVEAGPLTSDEAEWIDQLFTSYDVFRIDHDGTNPFNPYILAPILITDSTCEVHNSDDKLNAVKFTWRYANNRPSVRLSASSGIFTAPYNIVFS